MLPLNQPTPPHKFANLQLLTIDQACELLAVSRSTFWRRRKVCIIPPTIWVAGLLRVRLSDLSSLIEQKTLALPE